MGQANKAFQRALRGLRGRDAGPRWRGVGRYEACLQAVRPRGEASPLFIQISILLRDLQNTATIPLGALNGQQNALGAESAHI